MSGMEYGTDEHLDGLSRDALKSEVRWWYGRALEMEAENAELREERDMYRDLVGMMDHPDLNVQLQAENAKLRELVQDMWNGMCGYAHDCRSCEHYELYEGQRLVGECQYHARMRELGVEV